MSENRFPFCSSSHQRIFIIRAELTIDTNIKGTFNVLEAIRSAQLTRYTRFVLAGSSTEYGRTADTWSGPIPESAPMSPVSPYGVSKAAAELMANQYAYSYGMYVITLRFFIQAAAGGTEHIAVQEFSRQTAMIERDCSSQFLSMESFTHTKRHN